MTSRRRILQLIGGGAVLAATAVSGGCSTPGGVSQAARTPWRMAGRYDEFRRRALSYALLAPNPHNRQPWLVRLEGADALSLYVDLNRRLPATDPFDRQITIGCGAFLELLSIAAAQDGYAAEITAFPEGADLKSLDARPVARVRFAPSAARPDALFAHVLMRRSNKEIYTTRDPPAEALAGLAAGGQARGVLSQVSSDPVLTAKLRDLTWRAHLKEVMTPAAMQESVDLMRIGAEEVAANPDGIALEGAAIEAGRMLGLVSRRTLADPGSQAFRQGLDLYAKMAASARAFGWLSTQDETRLDQINTGRAYLRVNLTATALGLAIHPWSQALQEYPQMAELYQETHALIGGGRRVEMLYRIGYATPIPPTPRRGLDAHLV